MDDDSISDEDKALFLEHMRAVTPLKKNNKHSSRSITQRAPSPKKTSQEPDAHYESTFYLSDFISDPVNSNTQISYKVPSLSHQRSRDLQNGRIAWKARLDLHGLTIDAARQALTQFISTQMLNRINCILIVHGKGGHHGERPVIKNMVNRWLPQFEEVLAFHSAQPKDGGHGAVYVLLKKIKSCSN